MNKENLKKELNKLFLSLNYIADNYLSKRKITSKKAEVFYPALGVPDSNVQQSRMLRDWLLRTVLFARDKKGGGAMRDIYCRAVGCMKAHKEGREIKIVRASGW